MKPETGNLKLGNVEFKSRLILGTGKFSNTETMIRAIEASGTELVTVALRRFNQDKPADALCAPHSSAAN